MGSCIATLDSHVRYCARSSSLACCAFGTTETFYRDSPLLSGDDEQSLGLVGLTDARKTWGFGLLNVRDDFSGEGLTNEADFSLPGKSVTRDMDGIIEW